MHLVGEWEWMILDLGLGDWVWEVVDDLEVMGTSWGDGWGDGFIGDDGQ